MLVLHSAMLVWEDFYGVNGTAKVGQNDTSIVNLDEGVLLDIFEYLTVLDLLRVGQVCRQWYRISRDFSLWKSLDLRTLRKSLCRENSMENFLREHPVSKVINLDLSGLQLFGSTFTILATNSPHLRKLVLKSTSLGAEKVHHESFLFPTKLEYLDLRYSNGSAKFYLTVSRYLSSVKWLGVCDAFLYALYMDGRLETTIMNMQNLMSLDTSHCLLAKDNLVSMVASCRKLEVLSMRKCLCVRGNTLGELLSNCASLKGLILDGTSVDDDVVSSLPWEHTSINYLELGWCSFVSTEGLRVVLERLSRSKTLEYLGLCSTGDGKAINDAILEDFKRFFSTGLYCSLRTLNLTSAEKITKKGLRSFIEQYCPNLEVKVGNCSAVERFPIQTHTQTAGAWTCRDENNNKEPANRKWRNNFRSRNLNQMEQFYLESPL